MNFSRVLVYLTILLCLSSTSLERVKAHFVSPLPRADIDMQLEGIKDRIIFVETPDQLKYRLASEDIQQALSVDTPFGEEFTSRISLDVHKLLEATAKKNQREYMIPQAQSLQLMETQSGALLPENSALYGYTISENLFEKMLLTQLFSEEKKKAPVLIQIPVRRIDPKITLTKTDGTTETLEIVAHGTSDFSGSSQARIHNIETAMRKFQGVRIEPKAIFSFNTLLGEVDGSTGYEKELVIKGDRTIPDYGGGVCQVSSTVYRAALRAGFPIIERKPHSYAVSYYTPWGSDATIYPGVVDLRFTNDFTEPVYLHLYIEGSTLHTLLYGKSDGRLVEMTGPTTYAFQKTPEPKIEYVSTLAPGKRIWKDQSHRGFSAYWDRTITSGTGSQITERITSTYEARGGFVLEGKATELPLQSD